MNNPTNQKSGKSKGIGSLSMSLSILYSFFQFSSMVTHYGTSTLKENNPLYPNELRTLTQPLLPLRGVPGKTPADGQKTFLKKVFEKPGKPSNFSKLSGILTTSDQQQPVKRLG